MKITSLVSKNNRIQVFIDGNYYFSCTQNFVADNRLYKDLELTEVEADSLSKKARSSIIELKLFEYSLRGRYSEIELKRKVTLYCRKRYDFVPEDKFLNTTIEKARELRLYNSNRVINNLVRNYLGKSKSKRYIYTKLVSKGFSKEEVSRAVSTIEESKVESNLEKILERKFNSISSKEIDKFKLRQKLTQFAANKGYSFKEIKAALDKILN